MKTATVRDLRNRYTSLLSWIGAGEEIIITQRGKAIARLVPEPAPSTGKVDWSKSPEVMRDRSGDTMLTAEESEKLRHDAAGRW